MFCEIYAITSSFSVDFIVGQKYYKTNTYPFKGDGRYCFFIVKRHLFVGDFVKQEQHITRFVTLHMRLGN